jgi:hypothetical protein
VLRRGSLGRLPLLRGTGRTRAAPGPRGSHDEHDREGQYRREREPGQQDPEHHQSAGSRRAERVDAGEQALPEVCRPAAGQRRLRAERHPDGRLVDLALQRLQLCAQPVELLLALRQRRLRLEQLRGRLGAGHELGEPLHRFLERRDAGLQVHVLGRHVDGRAALGDDIAYAGQRRVGLVESVLGHAQREIGTCSCVTARAMHGHGLHGAACALRDLGDLVGGGIGVRDLDPDLARADHRARGSILNRLRAVLERSVCAGGVMGDLRAGEALGAGGASAGSRQGGARRERREEQSCCEQRGEG